MPGQGRVFVVAGSRDYPSFEQVEQTLRAILQPGDVVITGGARGVDEWAANLANAFRCRSEIMRADWTKYGRRAGIVRNRAMLDRLVKARSLGWQAKVVCFWDTKSPGTAHTINTARELELDLEVVEPEVG